jgi:2-polyprenyl-3-methyl-5-hydroxy-6-metoxy-1,4-benzoquinol methylase
MISDSRDGWNHNAHYHEFLLQALPHRCDRALDIGCGRGAFARRLSAVAGRVDALDCHPATLAHARSESASHSNIMFIEADFMSWPSVATYDVVSMIATLHHLPFDAALAKAASLVRPGGTLIVLGLDRKPFMHAATHALVAFPVSWWHRVTRDTTTVGAPIREPGMTLGEIRNRAGRIVPGAVFQRHLLWRYSMVFKRERGDQAGTGAQGF